MRIWRSFESSHELDTIWKICCSIGLFILILVLFTLTLIVQHLYCIPKSASNSSIVPQHISMYSILSAIFATFSVVLSFAAYFVCSQLLEGTVLGITLSILVWDFYIWAKLILYLLFIGRLFNPYYIRIYQYRQCIQYLLWMLLIILGIIMILFNILYGFYFVELHIPSMEVICSAVYTITDCTLSLSTMILFFRPFCYHRCRNTVSSDTGMPIVKQYCVISVLQLISALSYQLVFVAWACVERTKYYSTSVNVKIGYVGFYRVTQMLDCLLLMICIYFGFVRKQTVCINCAYLALLITLSLLSHSESELLRDLSYILYLVLLWML